MDRRQRRRPATAKHNVCDTILRCLPPTFRAIRCKRLKSLWATAMAVLSGLHIWFFFLFFKAMLVCQAKKRTARTGWRSIIRRNVRPRSIFRLNQYFLAHGPTPFDGRGHELQLICEPVHHVYTYSFAHLVVYRGHLWKVYEVYVPGMHLLWNVGQSQNTNFMGRGRNTQNHIFSEPKKHVRARATPQQVHNKGEWRATRNKSEAKRTSQ